MPEGKKPRRHHHLSRESIAREALAIVDRGGVEALSVRKLALALKVGPTNLYTYYPDRYSIGLAVVALLLNEVEPPRDPELTWEACLYEILASVRAMALRHPRAFPLVANAAYDEWPLMEYDRRLDSLVLDRGAPRDSYPKLASTLDAFVTGFLLLETQSVVSAFADARNPLRDSSAPAPQAAFTVTHPDEAFREGLESIIAGFKLLHGVG